MATYLDLKEGVANQLGKSDGSAYNAKREVAIRRGRRYYYSAKPWSFNRVYEASLTFTSRIASYSSAAPNLNRKFKPKVYRYVGTTKYEYALVEWDELPAYGADQYVFAWDKAGKRIKISTDDAALLMDYQQLPPDKTATDGSQDADEEAAPDITALEAVCIAYYWLLAERSQSKFELFKGEADKQIRLDWAADAAATPVRYFRPARVRVPRGYVGNGR